MSDDVTRLLERADAIEAEALAGKWLVGRTTHAPHYDDCLTCEPVRIAAALAARLRDAEAENARLKGIIGQARKALSRFERADVGDCDPLDLAKVADHALNLLGTPSTSESRDA